MLSWDLNLVLHRALSQVISRFETAASNILQMLKYCFVLFYCKIITNWSRWAWVFIWRSGYLKLQDQIKMDKVGGSVLWKIFEENISDAQIESTVEWRWSCSHPRRSRSARCNQAVTQHSISQIEKPTFLQAAASVVHARSQRCWPCDPIVEQ